LYLADQAGKFVPAPNDPDYWTMMKWLMWQASGFGPMLGQSHHFLHYNQGKSDYSEARFHKETKRLYAVLDGYLAGRTYMLDELSILEFAIWPWVSRFDYHKVDLNDFPNVKAWYLRFVDRPSFVRGYSVPDDLGPIPRPM
jgi:GST-like protein